MSVVAPLVGAWIEISAFSFGLLAKAVAPLVGAWIEIGYILVNDADLAVAPLVGAWIEILPLFCARLAMLSLPLWERGLKSPRRVRLTALSCRSPCGSVD